MTTKTTCDYCGAESAGRYVVTIAVSRPLTGFEERLNTDLCVRCAQKITDLMASISKLVRSP